MDSKKYVHTTLLFLDMTASNLGIMVMSSSDNEVWCVFIQIKRQGRTSPTTSYILF